MPFDIDPRYEPEARSYIGAWIVGAIVAGGVLWALAIYGAVRLIGG